MPENLEALVESAKNGDRQALEQVVLAVQPEVYRLALRFLWHPQDAEDASQEILVRIVTALSRFRGESSFRTWAYRVACNTLLTLRKQRLETIELTFESFGEDLATGLDLPHEESADRADRQLLLEELKIGCTLGMLQCLDRPQRLAYILGEILELDHNEAATALEITPATYRQRLARARAKIISFVQSKCGLAHPENPCRCHRRLGAAKVCGRVDPEHLLFATSRQQAKRFPQVLEEIRQLEATRRAAALYRSHPKAEVSGAFVDWLRRLLEHNRIRHG